MGNPEINVRATCNSCGDIKVPAQDVVIISDRDGQAPDMYRFDCPAPNHLESNPNTVVIKELQQVAKLALQATRQVVTIEFNSRISDKDIENRKTISASHGLQPDFSDELIALGLTDQITQELPRQSLEEVVAKELLGL